MSNEIQSRGGRGRGRGKGRGRGCGHFKQGGYRGGHQNNKPYTKRCHNSHDDSTDKKRAKFEVSERLKEVDIGVTEFVGTHEHFAGIVKERFADFHVHEINLDGEICKLTSQDFPVDVKVNDDTLKKNIPTEVLEKIELVNKNDADFKEIEIDVTSLDKEARKCIHTMVKKNVSVISQTVEKNDKKYIVIKKSDSKSSDGKRFNNNSHVNWTNRPGNYCQFLLHKVNVDTMEVLNQLGSILRIRPNNFNYAGTKDRRAQTTQWFSLRRVEPSDIHRACKRIRGAYAGNFKYVTEPLRLGMLSGNHFKIALRNITASNEIIDTAMTNLRDNGFINYYGLQRFGTIAEIPTYEIGKALLLSKWNDAIELILKPRSGESHDMSEARRIWAETKDAKAALVPVARNNKPEVKLLEGILKNGENNPLGALDALPRNTRTMYTHAYQSFVWNNIVSRRIREFGLKPVVGDLVYEKIDNTDETETLDYSQIDEDIKQTDDNKVTEKNDTPSDNNDTKLPAVKCLTEEDLPNYTFADIVMPQPGWRVVYPTYAKSWFEEFLEKDGLTTDLSQKNKKYTLGGGYRKILQVPKDVTWKTINYNQIIDNLILGDIEELRGQEPLKNDPEGKYKALIIEMSLKSSAYATMALREVLAHDTSSQSQAELSAAYHAKDAEETKQKKANDEANDETKIKDESVIDEEKDKSCDVEKKMDESAEPVVEPIDKEEMDELAKPVVEPIDKEEMNELAEPVVEPTDKQ